MLVNVSLHISCLRDKSKETSILPPEGLRFGSIFILVELLDYIFFFDFREVAKALVSMKRGSGRDTSKRFG